MKNGNKIQFFNFDKLKNIEIKPKFISKNEKFEKQIAEKVELHDEKLEQLLKEEKYKEAIKYKEDLVLRSKFNINKKENNP